MLTVLAKGLDPAPVVAFLATPARFEWIPLSPPAIDARPYKRAATSAAPAIHAFLNCLEPVDAAHVSLRSCVTHPRTQPIQVRCAAM